MLFLTSKTSADQVDIPSQDFSFQHHLKIY